MSTIWNIKSPNINSLNIPHLILDTNVLLDVFYSNSGKNSTDREKIYQNFITKCISKKIPLYTTELNIYECFHVIESINKELYDNSLSIKQYHKIKSETEKVHKDFKILYESIKKTLKILPASLSDVQISEYIDSTNLYLDLYDFALLKIAEENNIKFILTNDPDFWGNMEYIEKYYILTQNNHTDFVE